MNPAAGIFSRLSALSAASGNAELACSNAAGGRSRLGGMAACALCGQKLTSLESVLGPRGTQWHRACLICRGPPPAPKDSAAFYRRTPPQHCGKPLDSGAKVNRDGEVRCRSCYDRECSAFRVHA